jgi:hypothetical protein
MLTVPPVVGAVSRALLDDIHEYGLREAWMTVRIAAPLLLMPFRARKVQRAGLGGFVVLELVGLFRGGKPRRRRGKGMSGRTAAGPFHSAVPPKSSREGGTDKLEFTQLRLAAGMGKWFTKINFLGGRATEEMAVFRSSSEQSLAGDVAQR